MDSSMIKTLLDSQEKAYKNAMDAMVKQMNERTNQLQSTVSELTASLEYSQREIDDLKSSVKIYEKEKQEMKGAIETLKEEITAMKHQVEGLNERCNQQEDYSRRNNICISGMEEQRDGETWEQTAAAVSLLLKDKLQLPEVGLERAHRVGQQRDNKPRPVVARFTRYCDREAAMRNAAKLRGTNIYFNDDLCAASRAIKNSQLPQLKQARDQGKIAYFRYTKLIIKERTPTDNYRNPGGRSRKGEASDRTTEPDETARAESAGDVVGATGGSTTRVTRTAAREATGSTSTTLPSNQSKTQRKNTGK